MSSTLNASQIEAVKKLMSLSQMNVDVKLKQAFGLEVLETEDLVSALLSGQVDSTKFLNVLESKAQGFGFFDRLFPGLWRSFFFLRKELVIKAEDVWLDQTPNPKLAHEIDELILSAKAD